MSQPLSGPTTRARIKAQLGIVDTLDDAELDRIAAAVNAVVRSFPIAQATGSEALPLVNLVTNPSLEADAQGWISHNTGVTGSVWARSQAWSAGGTYSMHHAGVSGAADLGGGLRGFVGSYVLPWNGAPGYTVEAGKTYTAQSEVCVIQAPPDADPGLWHEIFFFDVLNNQIEQDNGPSRGLPVALGEQRIHVTAKAPAGAVLAQILPVMATKTVGVPLEFYADMVMFFEGDAPVDPFDGDTVADDVYAYAWTGAPNASTSTRAGGWSPRVEVGADMLGARLFRRKNSPSGVETFAGDGVVYVQRNDPDIAQLLALGDYAKPGVG